MFIFFVPVCTIFSHGIGEIDYLIDRIIFLKNGKKVVDCSKEKNIKEFKTLENFVTKYIINK